MTPIEDFLFAAGAGAPDGLRLTEKQVGELAEDIKKLRAIARGETAEDYDMPSALYAKAHRLAKASGDDF